MILPPFFHFLVILASFFGIEILIVLDSDPRTAASGVWCTMFFIYMTYTLLTLHLQECAVAGLMLAITQLSAAASLNYNDPNMSKQVIDCSYYLQIVFYRNVISAVQRFLHLLVEVYSCVSIAGLANVCMSKSKCPLQVQNENVVQALKGHHAMLLKCGKCS